MALLAGGAGASCVARLAWAEDVPSAIAVTPLSDNMIMYSGAGSNVVAVGGPDGVLLVNGGSPERSSALLDLIASRFKAPVKVLFNTDWHLDATGSNDKLGKAGAKIIAHENTRLWMTTEFHVQWQQKTYLPRPKEARPTETFYTTGSLTFGSEEARYGHLGQAHTDGDIYVFFPKQNVLVTGDTVAVGSYPVLDYSTGGWIGGLADATRTLLNLTNAETRVVPGIGPVQTRADLQAQSEMVSTMRTRFIELMRKGMSANQMLNQRPTKEYDAKWGNPEQFIYNAYPGLWNHVREIGGIV
jgi:glyoxylase-like metal-dependent hydrolase (beta-lactamase superfamily II)